MTPADRRVLGALQALVLALPLFLGGRHPIGVGLGLATALALLVWTIAARRRRDEAPPATGVAALAAFVALALLTTVPLPPTLLEAVSPHTAALVRDALPGWPGGGGWSEWRPLALHPHGVWLELCKIGIALAAFATIASYPWQAQLGEVDPRRRVFGTLLLTVIAGGAALSVLGLVQQAAGNGRVLWMLDGVADPRRASGPFVNPNHFASWLEMVIPPAVAYFAAVASRLGKRISRMAATSRAMGVKRRRAWAGAVAANQGRFSLPLLLAGAIGLMLVAHVASGSRGGRAALLAGLGVVGFGIASGSARGARARDRFAHPDGASRSASRSRVAPAALAAALGVASLLAIATWARLEDEVGAAGARGEVSLVARVAVASQGRGIVRDFPLLGTGLGSWLHAYRPYQAPPVEYGLWDHAHNDFLELAAETGLAGVALAAWFAIAVALVACGRRRAAGEGALSTPPGEGGWALPSLPPGFEVAEWRAALDRSRWLAFGAAGGATAALVHALVDFGLRLPANLVLAFVVAALLLLVRPAGAARGTADVGAPTGGGHRGSWALAALLALLLLAAAPVAADRVYEAAGRDPISPGGLLARADAVLAEEGDRAAAIGLVQRALDRSPADREAHEAMATVVGGGPESDVWLRRALRLDPCANEIRDRLARQLWERGEADAAATELEESIARYPDVDAHLFPAGEAVAGSAAQGFLRELERGAAMRYALADLPAPLADATERGLRRALAEPLGGRARQGVVEDLVLLLEARERWTDAAAELRAAAAPTPADAPQLARAANDYLRAGDAAAAEETLVAALELSPQDGELYRTLAVEVLAARGDFAAAEQVLHAAQDNSQDMLPVYRGLTRVLSMREAARFEAAVRVPEGEARLAGEVTAQLDAAPRGMVP
jgi:O-antigen ligase